MDYTTFSSEQLMQAIANNTAALGTGNGQTPANTSLSTIATNTGPQGAFKAGQAKIAVSGTAVQLGSNVLAGGVTIKAKLTNTANILIGGSSVTRTEDGTGSGYILSPGESIGLPISNTNLVYFNGLAGDIITWSGV